jgi:hypothetical protein
MPFAGTCFPPAVCVAAQTADPPTPEPVRCVYSDGSLLVTGPPAATCPAADSRAPFCGGACGTDRYCPDTRLGFITLGRQRPPCVGLSDQRGIGLCAYNEARCVRGNPDRTTFDRLECSLFYDDAPCSCMVTRESSGDGYGDLGYIVLHSACALYRSEHAGLVDCVNEHWETLP